MSTYSLEHDGEIATLALQRPYCLDIAGKRELADALRGLAEQQPSIRVLIVTSEVTEAMLVDVAELVEMSQEDGRALSASGHRLAAALETAPFATIAAVNGPALGGGCEFVMSCDLAYASEGAQLGQIEAMGGVIPGFGGTWRLAERVGQLRAREMIFTAAVLDAQAAKDAGLVLDVFPADVLLERCRAVAQRIASTSPASVGAAKRVLVGSRGLPPAAANLMEQANFAGLFGSDDQRGRMQAALATSVRS